MDWKVRFVDYPEQFRKWGPEMMEIVRKVLSQGDLILRRQLRDFEEHLAAFVGTRYAVGTSNCTDALHLTLRAAGIGAGDEVITVSHTFVATVAAIHHAGATPVLVDIGEDHNMDPESVEKAVTRRTKAIFPVHLNGRVCDMEKIGAMAKKHDLLVIEDAAQALGARFQGRGAGSFGLAGCFSFYPAKLLGAAGDAGALTTDSEEIAEKVRRLRDHGRMPSGEISGWSFNCRMDNLQAAILDFKLKKLPEWIEKRRQLAALYDQELRDLPSLKLPPPPRGDHVSFDVFQNYEIEAEARDPLVRHLKDRGIEILIPWGGRAVHQFKALEFPPFHLPVTERLFQKVVMLPMHTELTEAQVKYVADTVHEFYEHSRSRAQHAAV